MRSAIRACTGVTSAADGSWVSAIKAPARGHRRVVAREPSRRSIQMRLRVKRRGRAKNFAEAIGQPMIYRWLTQVAEGPRLMAYQLKGRPGCANWRHCLLLDRSYARNRRVFWTVAAASTVTAKRKVKSCQPSPKIIRNRSRCVTGHCMPTGSRSRRPISILKASYRQTQSVIAIGSDGSSFR